MRRKPVYYNSAFKTSVERIRSNVSIQLLFGGSADNRSRTHSYTSDCVALILASEDYDRGKYIYDYEEWLRLREKKYI